MGISEETGGSRGLQVTLHQFFGTTHKLFLVPLLRILYFHAALRKNKPRSSHWLDCWCANIVRIVDSVSPGSELRAMFFFLVLFNFTAVTTICHIFYSVFCYLVFANEEDGVCSLYSASYPLGKASKFVGGWGGPYLFVLGFSDQLPIIEVLSHFVVANKLGTFGIFLLSDLHVSLLCNSGSAMFWFIDFLS